MADRGSLRDERKLEGLANEGPVLIDRCRTSVEAACGSWRNVGRSCFYGWRCLLALQLELLSGVLVQWLAAMPAKWCAYYRSQHSQPAALLRTALLAVVRNEKTVARGLR